MSNKFDHLAGVRTLCVADELATTVKHVMDQQNSFQRLCDRLMSEARLGAFVYMTEGELPEAMCAELVRRGFSVKFVAGTHFARISW
jgi:hypothetical protein